MSLNKVLLIGNAGKEPEVRHLESGASVATLTLATSERFKDKSGALQEHTEWHTIICWRNLAEVAERFIHKGTQIYVEGRIRSREYTDQNGQKRRVTEILADNLQLLGRRSDSDQQGGYSQQQSQQQQSQQQSYGSQAVYSQPAPQQNIGETAPQEDDLPF